jgi:hypothetical protein
MPPGWLERYGDWLAARSRNGGESRKGRKRWLDPAGNGCLGADGCLQGGCCLGGTLAVMALVACGATSVALALSHLRDTRRTAARCTDGMITVGHGKSQRGEGRASWV